MVRPLGKFAGRARYNYLTRELARKARAEVVKNRVTAVSQALRELTEIHHAQHTTCKDLGPTSCPTWETIYMLKDILKKGLA
jgi:hypothetical protein